MNELVADADLAVRVRITEIGEPRWNSSSGEEWEGAFDTPPALFSDVRAEVLQVYEGKHIGNSLTVRVRGDARERYEGDGVPDMDGLSGGFTTQGTFILLLRRASFPGEDGSTTHWTLAQNFETNWRVSGNRAIGSASKWTKPVDTLVSDFKRSWRAQGRPS